MTTASVRLMLADVDERAALSQGNAGAEYCRCGGPGVLA